MREGLFAFLAHLLPFWKHFLFCIHNFHLLPPWSDIFFTCSNFKTIVNLHLEWLNRIILSSFAEKMNIFFVTIFFLIISISSLKYLLRFGVNSIYPSSLNHVCSWVLYSKRRRKKAQGILNVVGISIGYLNPMF